MRVIDRVAEILQRSSHVHYKRML